MKVELVKRMLWDEGVIFKKGTKGTMKMEGPQGWPLYTPNGETSGYDIAFDNEKDLWKHFKKI
jgi:hypothetical protein